MGTRRVLLSLGLVTVVLIGGLLAYRSPRVRSWFARDTENAQEIQQLGDKQLELSPIGDVAKGWFQWRGPTRDGRAPSGPLRTDWDKNPPRLMWQTPVRSGYSSCSVVGEKLFTQDYKSSEQSGNGRTSAGGIERVLCLNSITGEVIWEHEYAVNYNGLDYAAGPRATPAVEADRVYSVGATGNFKCLESPQGTNGKPRVVWEHNLIDEFESKLPTWGVACSPLIEGELVIVQPGGKTGSVVAFDKHTGKLRWRSGSNPSGYSSPVATTVDGVRVIYALTGDTFLAILAADGTISDTFRWETQHHGNIATPLVVDDYVFISSAYMQGCALLRSELVSGSVKLVPVYARRRPPGLQNHHASSVFKDRYLFGFDGDSVSRLKCISLDQGKEMWDAGREVGKGTITLSGDHLIIQTERGDLCLVSATHKEYELVARMSKVLSGNNNWATPTLLDGRLYLRDEQKVVCYDVRP